MIFGKCERCKCNLDPGEGTFYPGEGYLCDECIIEKEKERARKAAMSIVFAPDMQEGFKQMEMEDFLNGNNKVM